MSACARTFLVVCLALSAACGESPSTPPTVVSPPAAAPPAAPPPAPAPPPEPAEPAALDTLTVPSSMFGQSEAQGRVTLTKEAPRDGAVVALASSVVDTARTPASVTIPVGSTSATFVVAASTTSRGERQ